MTILSQARHHPALSSIEEVVEDARNGHMFILVDAEERENEGDLVIPAQMATPDAINFMAKHGRGLICLSLTPERAKQLHLELMPRSNHARHATAFTVSIEAREGITTGISAHDRAHTISVAIDPTKDYRDITTPGHVFPLVAREGGVLVRAGHTEAAVDMARLAGLYPAGVICEIMNDDGTMARLPDLIAFAQRHGIKIATIADLIAYRLPLRSSRQGGGRDEDRKRPWRRLRSQGLRDDRGSGRARGARQGRRRSGAPVLVRVHAVNTLDDVLAIGSHRDTLGAQGHGHHRQGRRGRHRADPREPPRRHLLPPEARAGADRTGQQRLIEYGVGAQILLDLGVREMVLLSNSPARKIVGLEGYGLSVVGHRALGVAVHEPQGPALRPDHRSALL